MELRQAARLYAEKGFKVFPLKPGKKTPLTKHGVKDATTDMEQIEAWWESLPNANIGVAAGVGKGKPVAVDLDVKHAENGIATWKKISKILGLDYGSAAVQRTPSNGVHIIWLNEENRHFPNSTATIAPAIDTRGSGGYFVAAPSKVDGKQYKWEKNSLLESTPPTLPSVVAGLLKDPLPIGSIDEVLGLLEELKDASDGDRNVTLNKVAFRMGHLVGANKISEKYARKVLFRTARRVIPDEPEKSQRTINSALKAGMDTPTNEAEGMQQIGSVQSLENVTKPKPRSWLVNDVVEREKLTMLVGQPGLYKSILAMDLAFSVASGTNWLEPDEGGMSIKIKGLNEGIDEMTPFETSQAPVLWIDLDQGSDELNRRMWAFMQRYNPPQDNFFYSDFPLLNLADGASIDWVVDRVYETRAELLIIDTFRRVFPWGMDENSSGVDQILKACRQITKATGVSILLLHHTNKGARSAVQENIRGSIAIAGGLDRAFLLEDTDEDAEDSDIIECVCIKRRGPSVDKFAFRTDFVTNGSGLTDIRVVQEALQTKENVKQTRYLELRKHLRELGCTDAESGPQIRTGDLMDYLRDIEDVGKHKSRSLVEMAVKKGFIHKEGVTTAQRYWA